MSRNQEKGHSYSEIFFDSKVNEKCFSPDCRAHFLHALLGSLISRTSKENAPPPRVGVLYNIGCTLEKGMTKVNSSSVGEYTITFFLIRTKSIWPQNNLFQDERARGQLKFGTSVFHAYVHQWLCQIKYNPRLNVGWGLSDGEGCERIWSSLSRLVSPLRYASKQNRLDSLHLKVQHLNFCARLDSGIYDFKRPLTRNINTDICLQNSKPSLHLGSSRKCRKSCKILKVYFINWK